MKAAPFAYRAPETVEDAIVELSRAGDEGKVLAGGQSLVPMLAFRLARPAVLVDINRLSGLEGIAVEDGLIRIGALARQRAVERAGVPVLAEALRHVAHPGVRNRGTVVGSLCHADASAELCAAALVLDAELSVRSVRGERSIPARELFQGPFTTSLEPDELALGARFRVPPGWRWRVLEVSRRAFDFALCGVVGGLSPDGSQARVAVFGAAPCPYRVDGPREELPARAAAAAEPSNDIHASAGYRRHLVEVLTRRVLA
ncbi:MAG: FAD binding domain-containing protein [Candidatus Dormibacteraceae bacterium]